MKQRYIAYALFALFALFAFAAPAAAQIPVVPGDRLGWTQQAASVTDAISYTYLVKIDTNAVLIINSPVCNPSTPQVTPPTFECSVPFPAATPSVPHQLTMAARRVVTVDGKPANLDSPYSSPALSFALEFVPGTPVNVRRISGS
jgi:hypothetical protein